MPDHPTHPRRLDRLGQAERVRPDPALLDQVSRELAELCVAEAGRLAEHDANAAENQAERASKNTAALVGALPILATAVSLIAQFFTGHPIHLGAGIGIAVGIVLFEVTFGLAVWNMGSDLPTDPQPHHSGWLGVYPHDRGHAPTIRQHYLTLAQDPITAYGREAIDVGHVAHRKHRRVRVIRLLTLVLLVEATVTFLLLWAGV